jgi:hypothetical protein
MIDADHIPLNNTTTPKWTYTLCGRPGTCCPVVTETSSGDFNIVDDHGGSVMLTAEQVRLLRTVIEHVETRV